METATETIYRIMVKYHGQAKELDMAEDKCTAEYLVTEYQLIYGRQGVVWAEDENGNRLE